MDPAEDGRLPRLSVDRLRPRLPERSVRGRGSLERDRPLSARTGDASMSLLVFLSLAKRKTLARTLASTAASAEL